MKDTYTYTVIKKNWEIEYETINKKEIDKYIEEHPNIFQVLYQKNGGQYHVYYSK